MRESIVTCSSLEEVEWHSWPSCSFTDGMAIFRYQITEDVSALPALLTILQPEEIQRSMRFHKLEDRHRFVYARAILRILSGMYTNQLPEQIQFDTSPTKKPLLINDAGWHVNISHSGSWILVAVGNVPVGIDVEEINKAFVFQDLLTASFSVQEEKYIGVGEESRWRFYQLWTRKEALVKATGKGIDEDFNKIPSLTGQHGIDSKLLGGTDGWTVNSFPVSYEYACAFAYFTTIANPKFYTLNSVLFELVKSKRRD